ncbi:hypothetical protein MXB_1054 [Myxobolus squamalis]|nr:hypothetical protein MXB_1054 [Myxobolus squamalis]
MMKYLNILRKRCVGNDQLNPILSRILSVLNPSESQLNSSIMSRKLHAKAEFSKLDESSRSKMAPNITRYTVNVPGISEIQLRRKVESLLLRIKGLKSFFTDSKCENIQIYAKPGFKLTLMAKILLTHTNISEIFLVLSEIGKLDFKVSIKPTVFDDELDGFSEDISFCSNSRIVVNPTTVNKSCSWSASFGSFFSRAFYW